MPEVDTLSMGETFRYGSTSVAPGERHHDRYEVGETYLGDPLEIPVTVVNVRKSPSRFSSQPNHEAIR